MENVTLKCNLTMTCHDYITHHSSVTKFIFLNTILNINLNYKILQIILNGIFYYSIAISNHSAV